MKSTIHENQKNNLQRLGKKAFLILALAFMTIAGAQETKQIPQINVSGEGKVKAVPDQAFISVSVDTKGNNATDVKKQNDIVVEKVIQAIKKSKLPKEDVQTQRISLNPQYDYDKKKYTYNATQTIQILLKDLSQYDGLMEELINAGINRITNVEFRSSKIDQLKSEARKLAMKEAKLKAEDYVSVLGQKVGKALTISDNTQVYYPQPMYQMKAMANGDASEQRETLAIGEIDITANVNVSFILD
ncbi:MAG TPA: SIMPL domain-containing protein [Flavobacterium sp.]|nr:SIMPL domain-containing protein [Flavobacterium sp.]